MWGDQMEGCREQRWAVLRREPLSSTVSAQTRGPHLGVARVG